MANNKLFSGLAHLDMHLSNDATGSGNGKDWFCFKCGGQGHFARDCPDLSKKDKANRPVTRYTVHFLTF